ncbi:MAG: DUF6997 domain-containing protein [Pontibacterium sp.]
MNGIFTNAINKAKSNVDGELVPLLFQKYVKDESVSVKGTAQHISVQTYKDLNSELKTEKYMVFRLGSRKREKGTFFSLAKVVNDWTDYFLFDSEIFKSSVKSDIEIDWESEIYLPFKLIPKLTETSHVNLALASGVLEEALGFDKGAVSVPATGRGSYTFSVKPHSKLNLVWEHTSGQVEIDSVIVASRHGKKHILVIEAKSGRYPDSLAKHKIVYPLLALLPQIPEEYTVTPIYMRIEETKEATTFYIAECCPVNRRASMAVNELRVCATSVVGLSNPYK